MIATETSKVDEIQELIEAEEAKLLDTSGPVKARIARLQREQLEAAEAEAIERARLESAVAEAEHRLLAVVPVAEKEIESIVSTIREASAAREAYEDVLRHARAAGLGFDRVPTLSERASRRDTPDGYSTHLLLVGWHAAAQADW